MNKNNKVKSNPNTPYFIWVTFYLYFEFMIIATLQLGMTTRKGEDWFHYPIPIPREEKSSSSSYPNSMGMKV